MSFQTFVPVYILPDFAKMRHLLEILKWGIGIFAAFCAETNKLFIYAVVNFSLFTAMASHSR